MGKSWLGRQESDDTEQKVTKAPEGGEKTVLDGPEPDIPGDELGAMANHRRLNGRQIQLLAIAGTIGAALFVGIGSSLRSGGPLSLLLGISLWCTVIFAVAQCQIETVTLFPIDGSFIRLAGRMCDESLGVAAGWNYFLNQCALICFDVTAFTTILGYWHVFNPAIFTSVLLGTYLALNVWNVAIFGEAEFFLAIGKVLLVFILMFYTFVSMLGGNPEHDRYGFRYWQNPGPMVEYIHDGALGRFQGFVSCIIGAAFIIAGPEYISMAAGEARNPRRSIPKAFNSIIYRLVAFFVIGALSVGIVCPSNAPELLGNTGSFAAKSPYIIGMTRLRVQVLPDIVNALIASSVASAANGYVFTSSRTLYSLARAGQAPKFFRKLNRNGVPYLCVICVIAISCLSYLSVSAGTNKVLGWWINLVTASQLLNWIFMSLTWLSLSNAIKKQGLDRKTFLPYVSRWQPFAAWYALVMSTIVLVISGYELFYPGAFQADSFIFTYGMIFVSAFIYIVWKVLKRTHINKGAEVDLVSDVAIFATYTDMIDEEDAAKPNTLARRIGNKIF